MAKKRQKTRKGRDAGSSSGGGSDKRSYWLEKLPRLVAQGRDAEALAAVDRFWPRTDLVGRVKALLEAWPARLASELPDPIPADIAELLGLAPLLLDDDAFGALCAVAAVAPLSEELRSLQSAVHLTTEGKSDAAREALTPIGLRSPFRQGRMFVRALCALQDGQDDEARRALGALVKSPFAPLAARVGGALAGDDPSLAEQLGLSSGTEAFMEALTLVTGPRATEALGRLAKLAGDLSPRAVSLLRRELPAALLSRGVPPRDVVTRVQRALGSDPDDPQNLRTRALLNERSGFTYEAIRQWLQAKDAVGKSMLRGVDRDLARAALLTRAGGLLLDDARHGPGYDFEDEFDEALSDAVAMFEDAIALDPGRKETWEKLRLALNTLMDRSAAIALSDRYAEAFPEDPDVQLQVARDHWWRRSFVKAAKHAKLAAKLAPHDPRVREVEADILVGRAMKQLTSGKTSPALATLREAQLVPDRGLANRVEVAARLALAEYAFGDPEASRRSIDELLDAGVGPWTVALHQRDALSDYVEARPPMAGFTFVTPDAPPTEEELTALLEWCESHGERLDVNPVLDGFTSELAAQAVHCSSEEALGLALSWTVGEDTLAVAEHATALFPDRAAFVVQRYDVALELEREPAYFATACEELEAAAESIRQRLLASLPEGLSAEMLDGVIDEVLARGGGPLSVLERVRHHLAQATRKGKKSGKRRTKKAGDEPENRPPRQLDIWS